MKKIFFFLLLFFISIIVNAKEETHYKWYKEETIGEYLLKGEISNYEFIDKDNPMYSEYSNSSPTCTKTVSNEIENVTIYKYSYLKKVKFLMLKAKYSEIIIDELNIYNNENILNYKIYDGYSYDKTNLIINPNGYMLIEFDEKISIKDFKMFLQTKSKNKVELIFRLSPDNTFMDTMVDILDKTDKELGYNPIWDIKKTFDKIDYSESKLIIDSKEVIEETEIWCSTREVYYYHYSVVRNYYDDNYHLYIEGYLKDIDNYQIIYFEEENNIEEDNDNYKNINFENLAKGNFFFEHKIPNQSNVNIKPSNYNKETSNNLQEEKGETVKISKIESSSYVFIIIIFIIVVKRITRKIRIMSMKNKI